MKQQANERKLGVKIMNKLDEIKEDERKKVRELGKKPYFLKQSKIKEIATEERYADLKSRGKLKKYLDRKQKKQHFKEKDAMPTRRMNDEYE
jgi:ribosomal RNA-processing protein 36